MYKTQSVSTSQIFEETKLSKANLGLIWLIPIVDWPEMFRISLYRISNQLAQCLISISILIKSDKSFWFKLLFCFFHALTQPFIYHIVCNSQLGAAELMLSCWVNKTCPGSEHAVLPSEKVISLPPGLEIWYNIPLFCLGYLTCGTGKGSLVNQFGNTTEADDLTWHLAVCWTFGYFVSK